MLLCTFVGTTPHDPHDGSEETPARKAVQSMGTVTADWMWSRVSGFGHARFGVPFLLMKSQPISCSAIEQRLEF